MQFIFRHELNDFFLSYAFSEEVAFVADGIISRKLIGVKLGPSLGGD